MVKEKKYFMEGDEIYMDPSNQNEERYYVGIGKTLYVFFTNEHTFETLYAQYKLDDVDYMECGTFAERDVLKPMDSAARELLKPYIALDQKANEHNLRILGTLDNGKTLIFSRLEKEIEPLVEMGEGAFLEKEPTYFRAKADDFEKLLLHSTKFSGAKSGGETLRTAVFVEVKDGEVVVS